MPAKSSVSPITHVARMITAAIVSVAVLVASVWGIRTWPSLQWFNLLVVPASIAAGLAPIARWYRRDAFPIGILFVVVMFFLLRWVYERTSPFL